MPLTDRLRLLAATVRRWFRTPAARTRAKADEAAVAREAERERRRAADLAGLWRQARELNAAGGGSARGGGRVVLGVGAVAGPDRGDGGPDPGVHLRAPLIGACREVRVYAPGRLGLALARHFDARTGREVVVRQCAEWVAGLDRAAPPGVIDVWVGPEGGVCARAADQCGGWWTRVDGVFGSAEFESDDLSRAPP